MHHVRLERPLTYSWCIAEPKILHIYGWIELIHTIFWTESHCLRAQGVGVRRKDEMCIVQLSQRCKVPLTFMSTSTTWTTGQTANNLHDFSTRKMLALRSCKADYLAMKAESSGAYANKTWKVQMQSLFISDLSLNFIKYHTRSTSRPPLFADWIELQVWGGVIIV